MLSKYVKSMFYVIKLGVTNVECLIKGKPQGVLSGSSNRGCYSHIALSVTYRSYWRRVLT